MRQNIFSEVKQYVTARSAAEFYGIHDVELVRQFLGHSDVQTTWGYIVNIDAEKEDRRRIVEALQGDPGTHIVDFTVYRMKGSSKGRKGGKKGRLVTG